MTEREKLEADIAAMLDHPNVFMGGPSHQSRRMARKILDYLSERGIVVVPKEPEYGNDMTEYEDWMIRPEERFCHRSGYDEKRWAPICTWDKCPRKVGMDCFLPVVPKEPVSTP